MATVKNKIFIPINEPGQSIENASGCTSVQYMVTYVPSWITISKPLNELYNDGENIVITRVSTNSGTTTRSDNIVIAQVDTNNPGVTLSTSTIRLVQDGQVINVKYSCENVVCPQVISASTDYVIAEWTEVETQVNSEGTVFGRDEISGMTGLTYCGTNSDSANTRTITGLSIEADKYTVNLPTITQNKNTYTTAATTSMYVVNGGNPVRCNATSVQVQHTSGITYEWEVYNEEYPLFKITSSENLGEVQIPNYERLENLKSYEDMDRTAIINVQLDDSETYEQSVGYVVSANTKTFAFYFQSTGTTSAFGLDVQYFAETTANTHYTTDFQPLHYDWEASESYTSQGATATIRWYDAYGEVTGMTNEYDNKMYHGKVTWTLTSKDPNVPSTDFTVTKHSETIEKDREIVRYHITQTQH